MHLLGNSANTDKFGSIQALLFTVNYKISFFNVNSDPAGSIIPSSSIILQSIITFNLSIKLSITSRHMKEGFAVGFHAVLPSIQTVYCL